MIGIPTTPGRATVAAAVPHAATPRAPHYGTFMSAIPSGEPEAARLGNPSFVWRSGQERRLGRIERYVPLEGRRVFDLGCGLGEYVRAFGRRGARALGGDIALDRLAQARLRARSTQAPGVDGFLAAAGEAMPFRDASLDVVVLNEVIEHVADDRQTLREIARVLRPGGTCVLFAPNRLYPFETHGIYWGRRYVFGNIPFVNWLPDALRNRLVPHARAYLHGDWRRLIEGTPLRIVDHTYVYPGFDNIAARSATLARILRAVCYRAEHSPLRRLGLSHLVVLRRDETSLERESASPAGEAQRERAVGGAS